MRNRQMEWGEGEGVAGDRDKLSSYLIFFFKFEV